MHALLLNTLPLLWSCLFEPLIVPVVFFNEFLTKISYFHLSLLAVSAIGYAVDTTFTLRALLWIDAEFDLPLRYQFSSSTGTSSGSTFRVP